ncbi:MAG: phosphate signaling complex protein PhoU [Planctomycetota bacterium]
MKHLQKDLERLKKHILFMGSLVEEATNKAISALLDRRPELAYEVRNGDGAIDEKEIEIEEEVLKTLALHQPVASDLRFVITVLKVNNDLERMGDLAANIAERAAYLCQHDPVSPPDSFGRMGEMVRRMVKQSLDSLVTLDTALARRVLDEDDVVDDAHREVFGQLQALMRRDPDTIERSVHTISASRNLERIADLATNIAEDVVFLVEGDVIRHQ